MSSDDLTALDPAAAEGIIENLRYGIPPHGYARHFTVGRSEELERLRRSLGNAKPQKGAALLVQANYGAGKSHLLQVVREMALEAGYAVSLVVVNAQGGVRFNRMDTIMGAVCARIEVPGGNGAGIGQLFTVFENSPQETRSTFEISGGGKWDYSEFLSSPGIYVALRAWVNSPTQSVHDLIEDWLTNLPEYRSQRSFLYQRLVAALRPKFRDPRAEWQFYADEVFAFHTGGHRNAWAAFADFDLIARSSGLRGLILIFDEFEDVIQNLNRRDYKQEAFLNLFRFFAGERFPGMGYFAVTPEFVAKCKAELMSRGVLDFDYGRFERLPTFEMSQIAERDFLELATRVRFVHGVAFEWDAVNAIPDRQLSRLVDRLWSVETPERVRLAIQGLIHALDNFLEGA